MRHKNIILYIIPLLLIMGSCGKDKIGQWDDIIQLSTKTAEFDALGDSITIKTGGDWWWVCGITVDTTTYDFSYVNLEADYNLIHEDCFTIQKIDNQTLFVKMDENPKAEIRKLIISLEAGDYFDYIIITQKAKL